MEPDDGTEPLLLQAKQAQRSVLAGYAGQSEYHNQGERVVAGQHLMQAVGDIFLGWQSATPPGRRSADYYFRQLRDWKYSAEIEGMNAAAMTGYTRMCGWTLARAHARTGDRIAIAAYLGKGTPFDRAITRFAMMDQQDPLLGRGFARIDMRDPDYGWTVEMQVKAAQRRQDPDRLALGLPVELLPRGFGLVLLARAVLGLAEDGAQQRGFSSAGFADEQHRGVLLQRLGAVDARDRRAEGDVARARRDVVDDQ